MRKLVIAWIALFVLLLVSACSSSGEQKATAETAAQNTVQEIDGVQTVTLSWGKLNYNPETITVTAGKPVKIIADLTRLQGCFLSLVIPDLGIEHYFDENNPAVAFTPTEKGIYQFGCAMGMGKGTLIVE